MTRIRKRLNSPARVEFLFDRVDPSEWRNSPSSDSQLVQSWLGWDVVEADTDRVELLQSVHREDFDAELGPTLDAASRQVKIDGMREDSLGIQPIGVGRRLSFRLAFNELPKRS